MNTCVGDSPEDGWRRGLAAGRVAGIVELFIDGTLTADAAIAQIERLATSGQIARTIADGGIVKIRAN